MAKCVFVLDVIVVHVDLPNDRIDDPNKLAVDATFNSVPIKITGSRINVVEFKSGRELQFSADPKYLRTSLEQCGMPVLVKYSGRTLGKGFVPWPPEIVDQISDQMSELMHVGTAEIVRGADVIGTVEVLSRLLLKCKEEEGVGEGDNKPNQLDNTINPHDILFVLGQSQKCPNPCDPCVDLWDNQSGDVKLDLDLARYSGVKNERMTPEALQPPASTACCELKRMAAEYEELIDSITNRVPKPHPNTIPRRMPTKPRRSIVGDGKTAGVCLEPDDSDDDKKKPCARQMSGGLPEMDIKPIRFCPVCLKNMSWLPKFAACPNCGVKPMPMLEDRHQPQKMTADQILMEYLGKTRNQHGDECQDPCRDGFLERTDGEKDEQSQTECRCTCKFGKICAHCRIRKLCADIFQSPASKEPECPKVEPKSSEDFCVVNTSSKDCRPYLARVFSELRDLYDIKDTNKKPSEFDEQCEQSTRKRRATKTDKDATDKTEAEKETHKQLDKEKSADKLEGTEKEARSKLVSTYKPPEAHGTKIGHKFCVNRNKKSVPRYMGWLWTANSEAKKNGWRPGAVRKPIKNIMRFFLHSSPNDNAYTKCKELALAQREVERQKPILNVCKKNGEIFITMRPTVTKSSGPLPKPIVFKIVKSELAHQLRDMKQVLKAKGFPKCTCHKPVYLCDCRSFMEKRRLTQALGQECAKRGVHNLVNKMVLTDTSESDVEFDVDVTPPAGVIRSVPIAPKPRTINHGTQWKKKDWEVQPKYPIKIDPYWRRYDCAVGDRYTGNAFGLPGEEVWEDGAFGGKGGGAHGPGGARAKQLTAMGFGGGRAGPGRGGVGGFGGGGFGRGGFGRGGFGGGGFGGGGRGFGRGGGGAGAGGGGPGGGAGGAGGGGKSGPIPVRQLKRDIKATAEKVAAAENAKFEEEAKRSKGIDMMTYLKKQGIVGGKGGRGGKDGKGGKGGTTGPVIGADGLTDAQRKRRRLMEVPVPPLCMIKRRGKAIDPCYPCYGPCDPRWIC